MVAEGEETLGDRANNPHLAIEALWAVIVEESAKDTRNNLVRQRAVKYPPDKQPEAIRLVIEQMEAMAQRYAA